MNSPRKYSNKPYPRSHEPVAWSLFGAGGMLVAFLGIALVLTTGLLVPLGLADVSALSYERVLGFARSWWGAGLMLACIALPAYHAAHRLYHGLHDLHIYGPNWLMLLLFYGGATLMTVVSAVYLLLL